MTVESKKIRWRGCWGCTLNYCDETSWKEFTWRPEMKFDDDIKMDVREIICEDRGGLNWLSIVIHRGLRHQKY
jgi:hypothetical protein